MTLTVCGPCLGPLHLFIYALLFHPHVGSSSCVCLHSHFIYFLFFPKPPKPLSRSALCLCVFLIFPVSSLYLQPVSFPQCSAGQCWAACNNIWIPSVLLDLAAFFTFTYSFSFSRLNVFHCVLSFTLANRHVLRTDSMKNVKPVPKPRELLLQSTEPVLIAH